MNTVEKYQLMDEIVKEIEPIEFVEYIMANYPYYIRNLELEIRAYDIDSDIERLEKELKDKRSINDKTSN